MSPQDIAGVAGARSFWAAILMGLTALTACFWTPEQR